MELNPYESPRPGTPVDERIPDDAYSVRQLLIEIRDGQRDLLELHRETLATQQQMLQRYRGFGRFGSWMVFFPVLVFMLISFGVRWYLFPIPTRPPYIPPTPARVAPAPSIVPPGASFERRAVP